MPFVANTPESLLGRNDSKNPNSTCRGLTASGRPCRRPITATNANSHSLFPPSRRPRTPDPRDESLYCWQHKEQASLSAHSSPGPRASATPILEEGHRTSLDTLTDRLGLVDLKEKEKRKDKYGGKPNGYNSAYGGNGNHVRPPKKKRDGRKPAQLKFCFCFTIPIEETHNSPPPPRPYPQPVQPTSASAPNLGRKSKHHQLDVSSNSPGKSSRKSNVSQTARLKDLIPNDLDTVTASALLTELAKPYTDSEEPGYIYMFWLTPEAAAPTTSSTRSRSNVAPADAARDLLAPPSASPRSRRASDVVASYADTHRSRGGSGATKKTMVLKIGRAANVQRRMNQWQRQCGRDVEVLRFYPYSSSSSTDASTPTAPPPRPAPHAKRVERLVHIELAGRGLKADGGTCEACGREHREWFEIEASRAAVREVDGVIRRWVNWDEEVG